MDYVVVGSIATPTPEQEARAAKNGGWRCTIICGKRVMWNDCVSPPFAQDYSALHRQLAGA